LGIFQLESSGLRDPAPIDRLLMVVAIAVLVSSLQGLACSWLQQAVVHAGRTLLAWIPRPLRELEPCIPSRGVLRRQKQPWFTRIELPPPPRQSHCWLSHHRLG
jgi:hypothetical protein